MTAAFDRFRTAVAGLRPRTAVVLGSGLGAAASAFSPAAEVGYADVPGMVPPTVAGHGGRLAVGAWGGVPAVVAFGRVHFYEGHPWERVTALVRHFADMCVRTLLLTNAAGGIHPRLGPGELMVISEHLKLLSPADCGRFVRSRVVGENPVRSHGYSSRLLSLLCELESAARRELLAGTYAALTGPCYETAAEILMLQSVRADAVGMSTAVEAEAAAEFGLEVAGLSCITNRAAGLADGPLHHAEVEVTARSAAARVADLVGRFVSAV